MRDRSPFRIRRRSSRRAPRFVVPTGDPRWMSKDDAPCCVARRLPDGRNPIGWCSPECVRRPKGDA